MIDADCLCYGYIRGSDRYVEAFKNNPLVTINHEYEETLSKEEEEYIKMDINTTKSTFLEYYKNGRITADSSINIITFSEKLSNKFKAQALGILPKKVIYRDKYTIVIWEDGKKTIVKCSEGDTFDKEKGFMMALTTRVYGKGVMNYLRKEYCEKVEKFEEMDNASEVK